MKLYNTAKCCYLIWVCDTMYLISQSEIQDESTRTTSGICSVLKVRRRNLLKTVGTLDQINTYHNPDELTLHQSENIGG